MRDRNCYYENEKLLVYFNSNLNVHQLSSGSLIIFRKQLLPIENFNSEFDYKKYCRLKHVYSQVFLKENEFAILEKQEEKPVFTGLNNLRRKLLIIIKNQLPRKSENSLLEALMVGFTDDVDPAVMKSYADTGVIHIIAISGLHLALICHILQLAFQSMGRKNTGRWIKFILMLCCLWGYSLLSGASPSVIRAAAMFSLLLFSRNILREPSIYNTLAASAFLLLCYDPYWLWDTGFQLSYAAVLGLCLFSKPVYNLLPLQNKSTSYRLECEFCQYCGAATHHATVHLLFSPVPQLFPHCQPVGRPFIKCHPAWRNTFMCFLLDPSGSITPGLVDCLNDQMPEWIYSICFSDYRGL